MQVDEACTFRLQRLTRPMKRIKLMECGGHCARVAQSHYILSHAVRSKVERREQRKQVLGFSSSNEERPAPLRNSGANKTLYEGKLSLSFSEGKEVVIQW